MMQVVEISEKTCQTFGDIYIFMQRSSEVLLANMRKRNFELNPTLVY